MLPALDAFSSLVLATDGAFSHSAPPPLPRSPPIGATVNVGVDASKVVITKIKLDKDRKVRNRQSKKHLVQQGRGRVGSRGVCRGPTISFAFGRGSRGAFQRRGRSVARPMRWGRAALATEGEGTLPSA